MRRALAASLATVATLAAATAAAPAATLETTTTSYATIGGDPGAAYSRLKLLPGWKRVIRDDLGATPQMGRLARRRSLLCFAQLSDFQLADEESPPPGTAAASFGPGALAALGREFAYNDPQAGVESRAEGRRQDRNVELLLPDPRER